MGKTKKKELATSGVKLNFTATELREIEGAVEAAGHRKVATWGRLQLLRAARKEAKAARAVAVSEARP